MTDKIFLAMLREAGLPAPTPEYRFDPTRRWRFDYAWPEHKVALEVEGGVFIRGRHSRGAGMIADMEKYNRAAVLGWAVIRCVPSALKSSQTIEDVKTLLTSKASFTH